MLRLSRLLPWVAAFLAAAAGAQSVAPSAVQPASAPPPYRSPLADYRAFTDEAVIPWREANDTVGRIGGWREYARESSQPAASTAQPDTPAAPAASPAPAAPTAPAGHGGHQH